MYNFRIFKVVLVEVKCIVKINMLIMMDDTIKKTVQLETLSNVIKGNKKIK